MHLLGWKDLEHKDKNTLDLTYTYILSQGQRLKRLQEKKIRKEIEEEQMRLADLEEAKYQEQRRKEIIEKAKTQLYCQTDRVKGLHVSLACALLCHLCIKLHNFT